MGLRDYIKSTILPDTLQILQRRDFTQQNPVVDGLRGEKRGSQVIRITSFSCMWTQYKRIETTVTAPLIQLSHVGVHVVDVIGVGRVERDIPVFGKGVFLVCSVKGGKWKRGKGGGGGG